MTLWALDTGRPGEFRQIETLGRTLGLVFETIRLGPDRTPPAALPMPGPRLILSFGNAARAALQLAGRCPVRPMLVHLGTPGQTPISAFDLIIPMPQDDYPAARNVQFLRLPLNGASLSAAPPPPRPGGGICTVVVGGPSRHFRLPVDAIRRLVRFGVRLAAANAEPLQIVTSPRTPARALQWLRGSAGPAGFTLLEYGASAYPAILQSGSRFVVTADSASMLAEALRTGAPVWLFKLPPRPNFSDFLQSATDRSFGSRFRHRLVRRGWVGGGTNFRRWHHELERLQEIRFARGQTGDALRWARPAARVDTDLQECQNRIISMLELSGFKPSA